MKNKMIIKQKEKIKAAIIMIWKRIGTRGIIDIVKILYRILA